MTGRRIGGIVCLLLALALGVAAVGSLHEALGPAISDPSGLGVSRAFGAFLPSLIALITGFWLFQKPKPAGRD